MYFRRLRLARGGRGVWFEVLETGRQVGGKKMALDESLSIYRREHVRLLKR